MTAAVLLAAAAFQSVLGPNVRIFSPSDDPAEVQRAVEDVFKRQHRRQFGTPGVPLPS